MNNESQKLEKNEKSENLMIDEFEIIELEDRLELSDRCNGRCDAQLDQF
jgi:hypothetical protein